MAIKPRKRTRGKRNERVVKKSLSLTPAAWKEVKTFAAHWAKGNGMPPNHSVSASSLIMIGADKIRHELKS